MIDFKNVITDFDLTVWKAVYYINKEQKNNNDIFPKYRTITSFMRCNEKSDHYEFYKKHPNVFGKFERFSSDSVQESLSKLVNLKKLRKEGDCYYSVSSPLKVALTCYGKMKLTHANFTRGFQSICFEKASNLEEVLDEEKYEILSNELLILKIYLKNDNCYIMIGDVEYKLSFRPIVYNELKIKVKERIEEINKQVARKRKAIQKKAEETVVKVTVEKKPKKESATKKTIKKEINKQSEKYYEVIELLRNNAPRKNKNEILESVRKRMISMSVGRVSIWDYKQFDNNFSWAASFKLLNYNRWSKGQLRRLDRHRNLMLNKLEKHLSKLSYDEVRKTKLTKKKHQMILYYYGKPFSYFGQIFKRW